VLVSTQGNGIFSTYFQPTGIGNPKASSQALLEQNYPNPATTETYIKFTVPGNDHVKIILYNQEGQKVKVILDQYVQAGSHEIFVSTTLLPGGIYYYCLNSSAGNVSRKMIVAK
jgi:hypothetical protein